MKPLLTVFALIGLTSPALAADGEDADLAATLAPDTSELGQQVDHARTPPARSSRTTTAGRSGNRSSSSRSASSSRSKTTSRTTTTTRTTTRSTARPAARAPAAQRPAARPPAHSAARPAARPPATRPATRPGSATSSRPAARPGNAPPPRVVRYHPGPRVTPPGPRRPGVVYGRPVRPVHRTVVVRHYRPWHGVFVYGPRPVYHSYYDSPQRPVRVQEEHLPERKVDREGSVAVGLRSGSYLTGYEGGSSYGDFGLGLVGRWRPDEAVGLELAVQHHNETFDGDTERAQTLAQGSAMLFANPWGRVQPYVLGGLSANRRSLDDAFIGGTGGAEILQTNDTLWGPHAGVGIEFAFGKRAALDLEARYVGWMNAGGVDPSASGALQTNAGFLVHF